MGVAIRAMENDLTLLDCYRTDKHKLGDIKTELQGELRLRQQHPRGRHPHRHPWRHPRPRYSEDAMGRHRQASRGSA
jgi:hypothetical protein